MALHLLFMSNLHILELDAYFTNSQRSILLLLSILSKYLHLPATLEHFHCKIRIYDEMGGKAFVEGLRTCSIWTLDTLVSQLRKVTIIICLFANLDEYNGEPITEEEIRDLLRQKMPMLHAQAILFLDVYVG